MDVSFIGKRSDFKCHEALKVCLHLNLLNKLKSLCFCLVQVGHKMLENWLLRKLPEERDEIFLEINSVEGIMFSVRIIIFIVNHIKINQFRSSIKQRGQIYSILTLTTIKATILTIPITVLILVTVIILPQLHQVRNRHQQHLGQLGQQRHLTVLYRAGGSC